MASDIPVASAEATELATVVGLYALGELTLGEAAERLDVSRIRMQEILQEAGVDLRLGPRTTGEAAAELDALRQDDR